MQKYKLFSIPQVFWRKNGFLSPKTIRKQSRFTQKELAELSGVTLRMIQAYEQGDQDILKAEAGTVFALARVLGCSAEAICN
ncbi:MAG: helix-turn-helix transcriptional regulator [Paludibacteraceae bacterium]|nr:helix-turn-helix transcriptional regulator [Paludibacteraceae bacterium]